jgi:hypothetical protein
MTVPGPQAGRHPDPSQPGDGVAVVGRQQTNRAHAGARDGGLAVSVLTEVIGFTLLLHG